MGFLDMARIRSPLPDDARKITGEALQGALVDLLYLSLAAKQVHWNLTGRNFRSVHLQLDEVVDVARRYSDTIAERAVAIGVNPDGRAATVAAESNLPAVEPGWIADSEGVTVMAATLVRSIENVRRYIADTAEADPVTQDLFLDVAAALEKHAWMFEAQLAP